MPRPSPAPASSPVPMPSFTPSIPAAPVSMVSPTRPPGPSISLSGIVPSVYDALRSSFFADTFLIAHPSPRIHSQCTKDAHLHVCASDLPICDAWPGYCGFVRYDFSLEKEFLKKCNLREDEATARQLDSTSRPPVCQGLKRRKRKNDPMMCGGCPHRAHRRLLPRLRPLPPRHPPRLPSAMRPPLLQRLQMLPAPSLPLLVQPPLVLGPWTWSVWQRRHRRRSPLR